MEQKDLLSTEPRTLRPEQTVGEALRLLLAHWMLAIPVVDASGRYLGMFGKSQLLQLALPSIARDRPLPHGAHPVDLSFSSDTVADMRVRLRDVIHQPVSRFLDATAPFVHPDTSTAETILMMHRARNFLPVVDRETGGFIGMVSTWEVLAKLGEDL